MSSADSQAVWTAWTDIAGWSTYEHIESASIDGEFRPGAVITSKARGFPTSTLTVSRVEPPELWVDESRSRGVRMTFDHVVEVNPGGTLLTERVVISGPLAGIVAPVVRRRLEALLATSVACVARAAETADARS